MQALTDALTKLACYRSRYADSDTIDDASGLTAADLDLDLDLDHHDGTGASP